MKYILKNDLLFLVKKKYKIIMVFFLVNLISLIINLNLDVDTFSKIVISTGTNITKENISILEFIILIFNNLFFVFVSLELFVKDFNYELDNVFIRMKVLRWLTIKNIFVFIVIILIKFIQYLLMFGIMFLLDELCIEITLIQLIFVDVISTLVVVSLYLMIYLFSIFFSNNNKLFYVVGILLIIILPHNVFGLCKILIQLILLLLLINIGIGAIMKFFHKKIIECIKE